MAPCSCKDLKPLPMSRRLGRASGIATLQKVLLIKAFVNNTHCHNQSLHHYLEVSAQKVKCIVVRYLRHAGRLEHSPRLPGNATPRPPPCRMVDKLAAYLADTATSL